MPRDLSLPIDSLREQVLEAIEARPVVLSAPTGSGKSTRVPAWLRSRGPVVVVEPRRVAARSLAVRVAELEGVEPGAEIGWVVRDEVRASRDTEVVFVTPGVALRWAASGRLARYRSLILDEFHERGMDLDLLLALQVRARRRAEPVPDLLVMSATLAGDRIARYLDGVHLMGEGRLHPVELRHLHDREVIPSIGGLETRVRQALQSVSDAPGDVLIFLPGKGEIRRVEAALQGVDAEVLPLHGGLSLDQQRRVFAPGPRRRVILSTNVAETSLTIPRIGVVIDSGLVRRTQYRNGRAHLTLLPIAADSADQRAGRAGRLGPGVAVRLWRADVRLDTQTPPELHREDLGQLVLAAAACGVPRVERLPFLDPPKPHALDDAIQRLTELGALREGDRTLTERGQRLFGLPLDAHLGRLLVEAEQRDTLAWVLPLAAGLSTSRPLLRPVGGRGGLLEDEDPMVDSTCDATAIIAAVCGARARHPAVDPRALEEARTALRRFCRAMDQPVEPFQRARTLSAEHRRKLADTLLAAWPRCAHIRRRHGKRFGWANGGTELSLGRDSKVQEEEQEVILVLDSRAFTPKPRKDELVITAAMPVPGSWLVAAGRGRERLGEVRVDRSVPGHVVADLECVYAGKVLSRTESIPEGSLAREALADLILRGSLRKGLRARLEQRHERRSLVLRLEGQPPLAPMRAWLTERLTTLDLQATDELDLLEDEDLLPEPIEPWVAEKLDRDFPAELRLGDAHYRCRYDVRRKVCVLQQVSGLRKEPPPTRLLPSVPGWGMEWAHKNRIRRIR